MKIRVLSIEEMTDKQIDFCDFAKQAFKDGDCTLEQLVKALQKRGVIIVEEC